jgi:heat shock protein HtpX
MSGKGLQTDIWNNNLKSIGLLGLYPFLIVGIVWACVAAFYELSGSGNMTVQNFQAANGSIDLAKNFVFDYWPVILTVVGGWFAIAYLFHTKMIRKMSHSHPVTRKEEPELYNLLENLCISIGMKMPRLEIIESHARNAFASGIDDKTFTVTVTRGLLQSLSKDEVEGVLAHELTHIRNRDVRLLIITIIFTGMIGFAAQLMWSNVRYGIWAGRRRSSGNNKNNSLIILFAILAILWIGYFATLFTRFAISRRREYMADAGAVQITKNPDAMMRALMRIAGKDQIPKMPGDINMMCIENRIPFMGLFATHPPIERRVESLSANSGFAVPNLPQLKPFHATRVERSEAVSKPEKQRDNWVTRQRFKRHKTKA